MQCDVRAVSDSDGRLHLRFGADGADWLHYIWSGRHIWLCSADGSRPVSVRRALKLLLREVWLRDDRLSEPLADPRSGTSAKPLSRVARLE